MDERSEQPEKKTFVIGDIHGCDIALDILLNRMDITQQDTVVLLGDVVDRGPGSKEVIDLLLNLKKFCKVVLIMGNHEEMMLDSMRGGASEGLWLQHGGQEALESYGGSYSDIPFEHVAFLESGKDYWENETEIFVHANLQPGVPLDFQEREWLRWTRLTGFEQSPNADKRVLCGHTPQPNGLPLVLDNWICLDTWAYNGFYLTCLETTTNMIYQAHQETQDFRYIQLEDI
jgi:Calcineurin-like phosphoesterase